VVELNRDQEEKACAVYYDNFYRLAFPHTCSAYNNRVVCVSFDKDVPRWCELTGLNVGRWVPYNGEVDDNELYYTDSNTGHIRQAETGTKDDDSNISYTWQSGFVPKGKPAGDFYLRRGWIDYEGEDTLTIAWEFDRGQGASDNTSITLDTDDRDYFAYPMGEEGRRCQWTISGNTDASLIVHEFTSEVYYRPRRPL